ncbi:DUF1661 domain-containing protein [Porphyromonas gingivalis]|nr:DUF1661 domain-containing protein [Porphyromonas gingivalis]MCE8174172.1 DUF1661 domain-containing protein [Porphyromonas gingivalis]MCE8176209.1 DUF1661 domain-containing protein [Porphyromonas gingivalis]MCE8191916.1 DUF1661 domain-containing protein [Porphyromonas gingivalis]RZQ69789.1 DUF1661 domain-containing protein [Porphyromonas gingivalis]
MSRSITCCLRNTHRKSSDCGACFLKMWSENFFVLARKFFASRTKTKKISRHPFRRRKRENFGA